MWRGVGETPGMTLVKARSAEKAGVRGGHSSGKTPSEGEKGMACLGTTRTP